MTPLARLIDHALLSPLLTDTELEAGCRTALDYGVAAVCIKPYAVPLAARLLAGSNVAVCTVIGFPHGSNATSIKIAETLQAIRDGATEIDMVVNLGKVLGGDWTYVSAEINALHQTCRENGAVLKVIFENDYLTDAQKIRLCTLCRHVEFIKTSTGFGFPKPDGAAYRGATPEDLALMLAHAGEGVRVKASGGIRTLEAALALREMGVARIGTSSTVTILEEARKQSIT